jgi:hypothetical protein
MHNKLTLQDKYTYGAYTANVPISHNFFALALGRVPVSSSSFSMHGLYLIGALLASTCISALPNSLLRRQNNIGIPGGVFVCTKDYFQGM